MTFENCQLTIEDCQIGLENPVKKARLYWKPNSYYKLLKKVELLSFYLMNTFIYHVFGFKKLNFNIIIQITLGLTNDLHDD